jgi:RNA polymerase sigma-70 factor (ECF subfamily)
LRNAIIDYYRRQAITERRLDAWAFQAPVNVDSADEDRQPVCECLMEVLHNLRPVYRQALQQVDMEGDALKAFAESAGITSGNAAVRIHRARQSFKRALLACCGACAEHGCVGCNGMCECADTKAG